MGRKEDRQNIRKAKIGILIILMIPLLVYAYYSFVFVQTKEIRMLIKVDEVIGINVENSSLNFGRTYPGSLVYRKVNLTNNFNFPVRVSILNAGEISDFVYVSENNFLLAPDELRQVTYYVDVPMDAEYRNFTGKSRVIFKRKL